MKPEKIDEQIKRNLFSANTGVVLSAIEAISNKGNSLYLPILFDLLNSVPEPDIEKEIINLLGTVKDKNCVNGFMRAIEDTKYRRIRKKILTACWQNDLDYSTFIPVFIDLVLNEDFEIAFEAFTVIDNLEYLPGNEIIQISKDMIKDGWSSASEETRYFLNEILVKLE